MIPAQVVAKGATPVRGIIDLTGKAGAVMTMKIGRGGTTALVVGVNIRINVLENGGTAVAGGMETPYWSTVSSIAAATSSTVNVNAAAGDVELKTAAITGWAAGDWLCIQDSGGGVTRLEFVQIAKLSVASGTGVTLCTPLAFAHTSVQADTVTNKADIFNEIELAGGAQYAVYYDYAAESAASQAVTVVSTARTLDYLFKDTITV